MIDKILEIMKKNNGIMTSSQLETYGIPKMLQKIM